MQLDKVEKNLSKENEDAIIFENIADPVMMAMFLLRDNPNVIRCGDNIYRFNGKCYDLVEDKDLDAMFLEFCINHGATKAWRNITSIIRAFLVYPTTIKIDKMNDYHDLICLNNGILNIHTKEFLPHPQPQYYFDSCINVDYDVDAKSCPVFAKYLNDTFSGDQETITNIIRLGGYLLDTSCAAEKMFLFDGPGANGKSVLINTFAMFFTEEQISPLSLDSLASTGFNKELLIKARVDFCAEQKRAYLDTEELKKIITGDRIDINRKYKVPMSFIPKMKIIVACNGLPRFNDTTHAIYRRMTLIRFKNQYLSEYEYSQIKEPERYGKFLKDKTLTDKIKKEKSSILNLFLEGLIELRKNNYEFVESQDSIIAMTEFKRDSDSVREFLEENYELCNEGDEPITIREVYDYYLYWYERNVQRHGVMKFRKNEMGKRIKEVFNVNPSGRTNVFDNISNKWFKETLYPIKVKPLEDETITEGEVVSDTPELNQEQIC